MAYAIKHIPATKSYPLAREESTQWEGESAPRADSGRYWDVLAANFWLILGVASLVTLLGVAYAMFATPVYRATILFQVEDVNALPRSVSPTDSLRPFDIKTVGAPELEVLRSRMVLSSAVDNTRAFIDIQPRYFPLIGGWLARQNITLPVGGLLNQGGYVWGPAYAEVNTFNVPAALEGLRFLLHAEGNGKWTLEQEDQGIRLAGKVGVPVKADTPAGPIEIKVDRLDGPAGAAFKLTRHPRLEAIEKLQRDIEVAEKGRQSGIISVSLEGTNPAKSTAILHEVVGQYLQQNEARRSEGAEKQLAFLSRQLPELRQALEQAEEKYNEARNRRGTIDLGEEGKGLLQMSVLSQTRLIELSQKRSELGAKFEAAHPNMQAIEEQIRTVTRELNSLNVRIKKLPQIEQEILRLSRDVKVNTEVYTNVMNAAQQLRLASASKVGNIRLLDPPETPVRPVKPRKAVVIFSAAAIGLLLGLLFALTRKALGGRVYSPGEIEQTLGLVVGGVILHSERKKPIFSSLRPGSDRGQLLPRDLPRDPAAEGLRRLQSTFFPAVTARGGEVAALEGPGAADSIIVVVGPTPGVGKSFVSSNLALVMASSGKRVLLIDADLRTGALHRQFGLERGAGLAEAIEHGNPVEDSVHRNVAPNLDFMSTGRLPGMPAMLLNSSSLGALLRKLAGRYDAIVIDTAPILAVADALMIAPHADLLLHVVRSGVTTMTEIEEVDRQLRRAGAKPGEVVYNDMRSRQSHYGYSAAYG